MTVFLVSYDLNKETARPPTVDEVKKTDWARLSESSYAIDTSETCDQVHARFKKHLDANDYFFVIPMKRPYSGYGPTAVINWLDEHLRY